MNKETEQKTNKVVAIIGSRDFSNKALVAQTMRGLQQAYEVTKVVSGGAKGADTLGVKWANKHKIEALVYLPDFKKHKRAYHYRNRQIVEAADLVIAFWNSSSTGTRYTINYVRQMEKEVLIVKY